MNTAIKFNSKYKIFINKTKNQGNQFSSNICSKLAIGFSEKVLRGSSVLSLVSSFASS
jgi:hypothetical protein